MKFFETPSSKNIIATLRIVTIEKSELTFLLKLYFHVLPRIQLFLNTKGGVELVSLPYFLHDF